KKIELPQILGRNRLPGGHDRHESEVGQLLRETVHMACHPLHRRKRHPSAVLVKRIWN
ncbi:hypothetical protein G3I76_07675, partial [Streptomyces sp. SID11233]|nr:hypothetical protein [Streptomyces sp. SID11233]